MKKRGRILEKETVIRLSREEARKVLALIANPPEPNKRLLKAIKEYRKFVKE